MNYALDALWWRLRRPEVRALAALLTAPDLWYTPHNIPVRELLGDTGFRLLLQWDDSNTPLPQPQENERLGYYAERLLQYWFSHAPHSRLLATNLTISDGTRTLGALDFVVELNGKTYHLELCCKYYGVSENGAMCGLNPEDTFTHKKALLFRQLELAQTEYGRAALNALGINPDQLHSMTIIRGTAFFPEAKLPENSAFLPQSWLGFCGLPAHDSPNRFCVLPRCAYLAPARVSREQTLSHHEIAQCHNVLLAEVALRDDGFWHEIARYMLR